MPPVGSIHIVYKCQEAFPEEKKIKPKFFRAIHILKSTIARFYITCISLCIHTVKLNTIHTSSLEIPDFITVLPLYAVNYLMNYHSVKIPSFKIS